MTVTVATKANLELVRKDIESVRQALDLFRQSVDMRFASFEKDLDRRLALQSSSLIMWLGGLQVLVAGLLFGALQLTLR